MTTGQLIGLGIAAVLGFWMLGAYNRLVALRGAVVAAWAQVDEPLQRRLAALSPLLELLREPLPHEHGTLDALLDAQSRLRTAADAMRARPLRPVQSGAVSAAEAALGAALARLLALLEQHPDLLDSEPVQGHVKALRDGEARVKFARQLFNDAVQAYNDAVRQFPTTLLARLFGLRPAGRL